MADKTLAVLGTGIMGAPMARNAARAGLTVRAWNRSANKARPLADDGVEVCDSPAEAVRGAELVATVLTSADIVAEVMEQAAEGLEQGAAWLQISTVGLAGTERLAELAQRLGVRFLDCPVSGTKAPAEQGKLVVLASGDASARDDAEPFLEAIGAKTVWLGDEPGAASRMKMVLNSWVVALTTATAETLALADALGIDGAQVLETLEGGPLDSAYLQMKGKMMLERDYPASFPLAHAGKDARLVLEAARGEGLELAGTQATADQFAKADEAGHGEADMAAVYEALAPRG